VVLVGLSLVKNFLSHELMATTQMINIIPYDFFIDCSLIVKT